MTEITWDDLTEAQRRALTCAQEAFTRHQANPQNLKWVWGNAYGQVHKLSARALVKRGLMNEEGVGRFVITDLGRAVYEAGQAGQVAPEVRAVDIATAYEQRLWHTGTLRTMLENVERKVLWIAKDGDLYDCDYDDDVLTPNLRDGDELLTYVPDPPAPPMPTDELADLRAQLAASQARAAQLETALEDTRKFLDTLPGGIGDVLKEHFVEAPEFWEWHQQVMWSAEKALKDDSGKEDSRG